MPSRVVIHEPPPEAQQPVARVVQTKGPLRLGSTETTAQLGEVIGTFARNDKLKTRVTIRGAPAGAGGSNTNITKGPGPQRAMTPREMLGSLTQRRKALEGQRGVIDAEIRELEQAIRLASDALKGGAQAVELDAESAAGDGDGDGKTVELLGSAEGGAEGDAGGEGADDEDGFPMPSPRDSKATLLVSVDQWNEEAPDQAIEIPDGATNAVIYDLLEAAVEGDGEDDA